MKKLVIHSITAGIILLTLISGAAVTAAPPERIAVTMNATDPTPTIGDSLTLVVTVSLPAGVASDTPYLPAESPYFDIQPQWQRSDSTGMNATVNEYGFLAYVFKPDTLQVGPFLVDYTTAAGDSGTVISGTYTFQVASVIQGQETAPKPDRSPVPMPGGFPWLIVIGVLALIAALVWFIIWRRRSKPESEPYIPIDDLDIFKHIAAMRLHEAGEYRKLYILLSDAIREYIYRRIGYDARFSTTAEIHLNLSGDQLHHATMPALLSILVEADMVKFAQYTPPRDEAATSVDRTIAVVRDINAEIAHDEERRAAEEASRGKQELEPAATAQREGED